MKIMIKENYIFFYFFNKMPAKAGRPKSKSALKKKLMELLAEEEEQNEENLSQNLNSQEWEQQQSTSHQSSERSDEIEELKKMIKDLQKQTSKPARKLSALNKFKKYVFNKSITDLAIAETPYIDLIPVDKMRLYNKAFPIVWEQLVLEPIYQKYQCATEEDRENIRNKRNIQLEYNLMVDNLIDQMKAGELDDQEHFREDLVNLFIEALHNAAQEFESDSESEEVEQEPEDM